MKTISKQPRGIALIGLSAAILVGTTITLQRIDASSLTLDPNTTRLLLGVISAIVFVLALLGVGLNIDFTSPQPKWIGSQWFRLGFSVAFAAIFLYSMLFVSRFGNLSDIKRINGVLVEYSHGAVGRELTDDEGAKSLRADGQLGLGATAWLSFLALIAGPVGIEFIRARWQHKTPKAAAKDERVAP